MGGLLASLKEEMSAGSGSFINKCNLVDSRVRVLSIRNLEKVKTRKLSGRSKEFKTLDEMIFGGRMN